MRIEFVRDYPPYVPGQTVDYPHDGAADALVRRGIARLPVLAGAVKPIVPKPAKPTRVRK